MYGLAPSLQSRRTHGFISQLLGLDAVGNDVNIRRIRDRIEQCTTLGRMGDLGAGSNSLGEIIIRHLRRGMLNSKCGLGTCLGAWEKNKQPKVAVGWMVEGNK